jgi:hypothetical protein
MVTAAESTEDQGETSGALKQHHRNQPAKSRANPAKQQRSDQVAGNAKPQGRDVE